MGQDRDTGIKEGGMAELRTKKGGKAGFENPYCGPSITRTWLIKAGSMLLLRKEVVFREDRIIPTTRRFKHGNISWE